MRPLSPATLQSVSEMSAACRPAAPRGPSRGIRRVLACPAMGARAKTAIAGSGVLGHRDAELNEELLVLRCLADAGRPPAREQEIQARLHALNDGRNFLDRRQHSALHGVRGGLNLLNEIGNHPVRANNLRA